jgi:hypothetical protein
MNGIMSDSRPVPALPDLGIGQWPPRRRGAIYWPRAACPSSRRSGVRQLKPRSQTISSLDRLVGCPHLVGARGRRGPPLDPAKSRIMVVDRLKHQKILP